jgi:hypothetical protein
MEGQGDSCSVEPLEERGSNSAVGFDMCLTLAITWPQGELNGEGGFAVAAQVHGDVML